MDILRKGVWSLLLPLLFGVAGCDENEKYEVSIYKPDKVWDSYTLPSSALGGNTPVLDMNGNVVAHYGCAGVPARVLPDASIICHASNIGGPVQKTLQQISATGEVLWEFNDWIDGSAKQHHDYQLAGNPVGYYAPGMEMIGPANGGNMLVLAYKPYKKNQQDIRDGYLSDSVLYEIDPSGDILWQWHAKEHIDEMGFSEAAIKDLKFDLFLFDWLHVNTASYIGPNKWYSELGDERFNPDNIMIESPHARWVIIIEKATGKIVWRLGPDYSPGKPGADFRGLNFAHGAHIIPQGLPGAGNLLIFDNGTFSGYGDQHERLRQSRTLEINPIDFSVVWEYQHKVISPVLGYAQRLPNGNTFITEGFTGRLLEVTPGKEVVWKARAKTPQYRAYRIPKEWIKNPG